MTQILIICKTNVDKSPKRPEFRAFWRCGRSYAAPSPDRRSVGTRPPAGNSGQGASTIAQRLDGSKRRGWFRP
jgi:hypothetical protein